MSYVVHKEFQKMIKMPNKKPVIEEVSMDQTYDGNKANISLHMRKNNKKRDVSLSLNNDEVIQLMKNRPSIDEMLHKRLTHDFSSILNGHLDAAAAAKSKPSLLLNRQFPIMRVSVSGTKSRSIRSRRKASGSKNRGYTKKTRGSKMKASKSIKSLKSVKKTVKRRS
jgi:hypothetical protein